MIGIIDYGMGNLRSVQKAFEHLQVEARILSSPRELSNVEGVVLPGVGAFRDAISELKRHDFPNAIHDTVEAGVPLIGICLGQQLLFDVSYEDGEFEGLGLIRGDVVRFDPEPGLKIPHMGWNAVELHGEPTLFRQLSSGDYVYFVHSYYVRPADDAVVAARTTHGTQTFASAIQRNNLFATQFHPEKSQRVGLQILRNFANLVSCSNTPSTTN